MAYKPLPENLTANKPATSHTHAAQEQVKSSLDFSNRKSFADAQRGFIATLNPLTLRREDGHITFDLAHMEFLNDEAPATVNPSLWRQSQLNAQYNGLFEVVDGIYQVRSFDIANMTLIRSNTGWIIIDPLTSSESSAAALALANEHLGERPVVAVLITHSHADHFAGVLGVVSHEQVRSGEVPLIAPEDFVDESLNENVLAGNAMNRRATYMYGNLLPASATGYVTTGLGAAVSMGSTGFIVPSDFIYKTGETRTIDGVEIEFQMTPGTEAPAEFVFYLPAFKALCMAEITSHHLHNVYTPRGAQVRDALEWSSQINESIDLFGHRIDVQFASHHWPIWGQEDAIDYLEKQRDLYKYIHDQTLRLANNGYTKEEIAEQVHLPDSLGQEFYNRDYYGTVHHNCRAVYVKYLGFFDGNPSTLYQLPPVEQANRYMNFMGGADAVVEKARGSFDAGDYRWVAEVLNHVVMSDPEHIAGRALLADTLEQLGYQSESAPWRNFYLCGALELRQGLPETKAFQASGGIAAGMPIENFFQTLAVRLLPTAADGLAVGILLKLTDMEDNYLITIKNSVFNYFKNKESAADTTLTVSSADFKKLIMGITDGPTLMSENKLDIAGNAQVMLGFAQLFDQFPRRFPLVTPRD
ncbi:MAG: MBL fold metallo-hydrolase [Gammaproteobacteria bacterium]|jgi:alkyl sulfatase BDS1-like metallo-beta-lactamase superfamily hydrolase|nr:MBL fold metallo-hydrolase [Gammaproteobacteria bacterium]